MDQFLIKPAGRSTKQHEIPRTNSFSLHSSLFTLHSFQLTPDEFEDLKSQIVTSSWGGMRRALPYAFTEQGIAMLSGVLKSPRAIQVNIQIMRAFVMLRQMLASNAELEGKLDQLERKYDRQFKIVFDAIRQPMSPPLGKPKVIGFRTSARKK